MHWYYGYGGMALVFLIGIVVIGGVVALVALALRRPNDDPRSAQRILETRRASSEIDVPGRPCEGGRPCSDVTSGRARGTTAREDRSESNEDEEFAVKVAVATEPGALLEVREAPVPEPAAGQVVVRLEASGIRHTRHPRRQR
ncbi:hypothetical protein ACIQMJ_26455 [Actinosynnema sp. NPDC091369]